MRCMRVSPSPSFSRALSGAPPASAGFSSSLLNKNPNIVTRAIIQGSGLELNQKLLFLLKQKLELNQKLLFLHFLICDLQGFVR